MLGHVLIALLGSALVMLVLGLGLGVMVARATSDAGRIGSVTGAALVMVPAVWVLVGVTTLLVGALPRWSSAAWCAVALAVVITLFGPLANVSQRVLDVSPFTHVPKLPAAHLTWTPLLWLTAVALVLGAAGVTAMQRRDLS